MKRILATALAVLLIATMAISGSVAYLTSTDNDTNTFTMGDVEIIQHEKDRNGNTFNNEQNLLPGHEFRDGHNAATTSVSISGTEYNLWNTESGAIDKIVTVENTGKTSAYVRTIFALEDTGMIATNNQIKLNWNTTDGNVNDAINGRVLINGEYYRLYEYTYNAALKPKATTAPSLLQVAMSAKVGNDIVDAIAASADGHYTILVATQAVQYDNMVEMVNDAMKSMSAEAALDAAFYDVTSENNPWTKGEVEDSEAENAGTVIYLNNKSDVLTKLGGGITENTTFILTDDINMDGEDLPTTHVGTNAKGCNVKFVGNDHTISNVTLVKNPDVANYNNILSVGLFALTGTDMAHSELTVENLTLRNVTAINSESSGYAAAVVAYVNNNNSVTLKNVNVYDATVKNSDSDAAIFVGYIANSTATLTDCKAGGKCTLEGESKEKKDNAFTYDSSIQENHRKHGVFFSTVNCNPNSGSATVNISGCVNGTEYPDWCRKRNDTGISVNGAGIVPTTASDSKSLSTVISSATNDTAYVKLSDATYQLPASV